MLFSKITDAESTILSNVSSALGIPSDWLYQLIDFESKWNPAAVNPYSAARGLIQWTNTTARGMGYASALDLVNKSPDRISQLIGPVFEYLKPYRPFPTQQSLAMAVFYPKYRSVPADTAFPVNVLAQNPGIKTPADYMKKVFPISLAALAASPTGQAVIKTATKGGGLVALALAFIFITSQKG